MHDRTQTRLDLAYRSARWCVYVFFAIACVVFAAEPNLMYHKLTLGAGIFLCLAASGFWVQWWVEQEENAS
jgi:hypothetical protein